MTTDKTKPTDLYQLQLTDRTQFTEYTKSAFAQTTIPINIHNVNLFSTIIILTADKHNISKGKMYSNCLLLSGEIVCKITQINYMGRANTYDPSLRLLNDVITSDIHKHNIYKDHLDACRDHMHNTHMTWKTIHGLSNRLPPPRLNTSKTFNNKITTTPKNIANCSSNNSQTLWTTKHRRQIDPLTEQHNSGPKINKVKITTHMVLTNKTSGT